MTRVAGDLLSAPRGVAVAPDGRRVWVVDLGASGVIQLYGWQRAPDGKLRRPVRTWSRPAPEFGALGILGDGPGPFPRGSVVLGGSGQLLVFTPEGAPDTSLWLGALPDGVQSVRALAVGGPEGRTVAVSLAGEGGSTGLLLRVRLTDRD